MVMVVVMTQDDRYGTHGEYVRKKIPTYTVPLRGRLVVFSLKLPHS